MNVDKSKILSILKQIKYRESDIVSSNIVSSIVIKEDNVGFVLEFPKNEIRNMESLRVACQDAIRSIKGVKQVTAVLTNNPNTNQDSKKNTTKRRDVVGVKHIIAVASGKGGVGKSTTAVNLSLALTRAKYKVGIIDADIHGPSIPQMLSMHNKPEIDNDNYLIPTKNYGIHAVSMGFLAKKNRATIWRGPMLVKALYQLILNSKWQDIDYLIVDLPPGTGDIHLSLAENFNISGAVIVSTPQQIAITEAYKAFDMFTKMSVPVIGVVENMSYYMQNQEKFYIFGKDGGKEMSKELNIKLLGEIPLDSKIREYCDIGKPIMLSTDIMENYDRIAHGIIEHSG